MVNRHIFRPLEQLFVATLILLFAACSKEDRVGAGSAKLTEYRVAVVLPASNQERWDQISAWNHSNMQSAQSGLKSGVKLNIEWIDEESANLEQLLKSASQDSDLAAIIGPYSSSNAMVAAQYCVLEDKTLILPTASSTELHRLYAGKGFMWALVEADITQSEILLMRAKERGATEVSLICSDDIYGQSFSDWLGFQAIEVGLSVHRVYEYSSQDDLGESISDATAVAKSRAEYNHMIIFAPSSDEDMLYFDQQRVKLTASGVVFPTILCSDTALSSRVIDSVESNYEGLAICASPLSGFYDSYLDRFDQIPLTAESHLYDALSMATLGLYVKQENGLSSLTEAIETMVSGDDSGSISWDEMNSSTVFNTLSNNIYPTLKGAVGSWLFDKDQCISLLSSTYLLWSIEEGEFTPISYISTDDDLMDDDDSSIWEWDTTVYQEFDSESEVFNYPDLEDRWALIVAGSEGWSNYRHQADAHAMYDLLIRHGYTDDHIVLIVADDIAYNSNNLYPGNIHVIEGGENLYSASTIDYCLSDLDPSDLRSILLGEVSSKTPEVINSSECDNIFIFWSGHGSYNRLYWGSNSYSYLSASELNSTLAEMAQESRYRKLFVALEACYGGSMAESCEGIEGLLFMTAANATETSKADVRDSEMNIWLSNAFTRSFQESIDTTPTVTLSDLYYKLAQSTSGSHVTVYNYQYFDNMLTTSMEDFF